MSPVVVPGLTPVIRSLLPRPEDKQLERVADARGAAGQDHDAVGVAVERDLLLRQKPDEEAEAGRQQKSAQDGEPQRRSQ